MAQENPGNPDDHSTIDNLANCDNLVANHDTLVANRDNLLAALHTIKEGRAKYIQSLKNIAEALENDINANPNTSDELKADQDATRTALEIALDNDLHELNYLDPVCDNLASTLNAYLTRLAELRAKKTE